MSIFYKQNAAARFFVDQTNGKVYEVVGDRRRCCAGEFDWAGIGVAVYDIIGGGGEGC